MAIEKRECENCEAEYVVAGDDVYIGGYAKKGSTEDVRKFTSRETRKDVTATQCPLCGSRHTHIKKNEPQRSNLKFKGSPTIVEDDT